MLSFVSFRISPLLCFLFILPNAYGKEVSYFGQPFQSYQLEPSQSNKGGVGLMQMPTGRMAEDGAFSFGYNKSNEYQFYSVSLQLMPWLETTIRYTQTENVLYNSNSDFSGDTKHADKGIDAKLRLWQESHWLPEVSVGLSDIGGTGLFDGEFIAATKRFSTQDYGQFDLTLGIGWGYFGTRGNVSNPLCTAAERFCNRLDGYSGNGGSVDYNRWFTGPASIFAGVEYQTPYEPLRLKLEYDGNDYSEDFPVRRGGVNMTPKTPWNIGAVYGVSDSFDIRLSYERGTTFSLGFNLSTNFDTMTTPWIDDTPPSLGHNQAHHIEDVDWHQVDQELKKYAGYNTQKIYQQGDNITIVSDQNAKYRDRDLALERAATVLANHLPTDTKSYTITEKKQSIPVKSTQVSAKDFQDIANVSYFNPSISDALTDIPAREVSDNAEPLFDNFEPLEYSFTPHLTQSLGGPEGFYLYSLSLDGGASYWLSDHLQLSSQISLNLVDNYDKMRFEVIPDGTSNYRVRTLIRAYIRDNDANVSNLQLTWFQKYGQNWYQQIYGGYLETMFAGVGTELLYRQQNSNWAIGLDVNAIAQRDPHSLFGIFPEDTDYGPNDKVLARGTTGHLSFYYQPEWSFLNDTRLQMDIGKFLATDMGVRFDFSKQYRSGMIVGAFASITNMSAEQFGEGSFTKGFYLSIPFDAVSLKPTNSRGNIAWQPITRDGGQMLGKYNGLYTITDSVSPWFQRPNQNEQIIINQ